MDTPAQNTVPEPQAKTVRSDHRANRDRLIAAAARLFEAGGDVRLADIAKAADLSVATAYRHFDSVDDVVDAYRRTILDRLRIFADTAEPDEEELIDAASRYWVSLVLEEGAALVQRRSHEGFLDRANRGAVGPALQVRAMDRPLLRVIALLGIGDVPGIRMHASFLWNLLFDPREIFDLRRTRELSAEQIAANLSAAFRGALFAWATETATQQRS